MGQRSYLFSLNLETIGDSMTVGSLLTEEILHFLVPLPNGGLVVPNQTTSAKPLKKQMMQLLLLCRMLSLKKEKKMLMVTTTMLVITTLLSRYINDQSFLWIRYLVFKVHLIPIEINLTCK